MTFGDLFFLFIFLAIILVNIYKKMKRPARAPEAEKPKPKSSWRELLEDALKQLEEKVPQEAAPEAGEFPASRQTGWEAIVSKEKTATLKRAEPPKPVMETLSVERPEGLVTVEAAEQPMAWEDRHPPEMDGADIPVPGLAVKGGRPESHSLRELRHAVVWSEILSPPLGIRDLQDWDR
jgi:hypothetical protein